MNKKGPDNTGPRGTPALTAGCAEMLHVEHIGGGQLGVDLALELAGGAVAGTSIMLKLSSMDTPVPSFLGRWWSGWACPMVKVFHRLPLRS